MEKSTAHYKLERVRALIAAKRVCFTRSATQGVRNLGLEYLEAEDVISRLQQQDFYKSMTAYADHRIWHDVYHPRTRNGAAYVKLTIEDELLVVSFKIR